MPELPEVETVRRGLMPALEGARFQRVTQRRHDLRFPLPERFCARLEGRRLERLGRRAKYLVADIEGGETLIMHLGMSGRFTVAGAKGSGVGGSGVRGSGAQVGEFVHETGTPSAHDHVVFEMSNGATVTYNDPRRFGFMLICPTDTLAEHKLIAGLGPEPLSNAFHAGYLAERARNRSSDLKAFLLDQRIIAGLGNIYVSEALHRAQISPNRAAGSLADRRGRATARTERLVPAIRSVLEEAIAAGGSTLKDYAHTDGSLGYFQHAFRVYGRDGEACATPGCRGVVRRIVQAGRSTFYCGTCQR